MRHHSPITNHQSLLTSPFFLACFFAVFCFSIGTVEAETRIKQGQIEQAVRTAVLSSDATESEQVEVHVKRWRDTVVDGDGSVVLKGIPATKKPLRGTVPFKIEAWRHGEVVRRWMVTADVRLFEHVAVSLRRLKRHHVVTAEDVAFQRRDVTDISGGFFTGEIAEAAETDKKAEQRAAVKREELIGKRMKKTVGIGRIISRKDVEEPPIILRGSSVTILAQMGGLTVRTTGKALEDGWLGERIKVRNEASKARLVAEVVDERTVRTRF